MHSESQIQNRHEPAEHFSRRECRRAFGYFCDEIRRARLTPTQRDLALLIAGDTLGAGFLSVLYTKLEDLVLDEPGQPAILNLQRNDISPALNALNGFGIVRADRVQFESNMVWLVLVLPNSAQWRMGAQDWRFLPDRLERRRMHLNAQRRRAARYLAGLAPDLDLWEALAAEGLRTCPASAPDALNESEQTARGRNPLSSNRSDALTVLPPMKTPTAIVRRSESRNAEPLIIDGKRHDVPEVRTPLRHKTQAQDLKNNLKDWTAYSIEQKKEALIELEHCSSDDRVRILLGIILGDDVTGRDGGKWIKARWSQATTVHRVMCAVVERCFDLAAPKVGSTGGLAHEYGRSFGVVFGLSYKKSKESFSVPIKAR